MKTRNDATPVCVRTRTKQSIRFTRSTALVVLTIVVAAAFYSASSASPPRALRANMSAVSSARETNTGLKADFFSAVSALGGQPRGTAPLRPMFAGESVETFAADCETGKTLFDLGETVCVRVTGAGGGLHRLTWVDPANIGVRSIDITSDPQTDTFTLPSTTSSVVGGQTVDNRGSWRAIVTSIVFATTEASAPFIVRDPASASVDLAIYSSGSYDVSPGSNVTFTLLVTNYGPDTAQDVQITDSVPANTTFVAETQDSGPAFSCSNPSAGGTGTTTCTIASLPKDATAIFTLVYSVSSEASNGTTISNVATVSSSTSEIHTWDNTWQSNTIVRNAPPGQCTIACPQNISVDNDPNAANPCVATVTYTTPTTSGACADPETGQTPPVICSPPSGSAFPIGSNTVTCSSGGTACSFIVTVHETRTATTPTITCPGNVTTNEEFPDAGAANVNYSSPTATGNCVTIVCDPPSGFRFLVGATTVTCTATTDDTPSLPPATCTFTVTVTSGNCSLTCPGDVTQNADAGQCNAVVSYPAPTTSGTCGTVTCTPASGSVFPVGATVVTCAISGEASCDFTVTVNAPAAPTITTCAPNRTISVNANCEAAIPNLVGDGTHNTGEVVTTGCSVVVSQSPAGGTIVGPGTYTVTITAENSAGDATCTATVTVADTTPPLITSPCPTGTSASANSNCHASVPNVTGGVTATDNCTDAGSLTITQSPVAGTLVGVGTTTITITVKDASNNAAACTTTFTVNDTTPPTAVCKNITVALNASGNASIAAADIDNGSSDNCGITSRTVSPSTFTCANKGANTVTLTVKDAANNPATCQATVTVVDNTPPTIACLSDIIVDFDPGVGGAIVTYATPVGTDNCPGATTTQIAGLPSGATFPVGNTTNTFRVTDAGGLTAQCSFKVTVALTSIIGLDSVSISGAALVDSYDSNGGYPATKGSLANVVSNGTITLANSGKVSGNVRSTRAGVAMSGASQVTGNATAGTTVSRSGSATVGGTITNNQLAPVMTLPSVSACGPPYSSNSGISGTYSYNPSTGDLSLSGVNIATLANGTYCFHNVTLTNSAQLRINGPVVIKMTGTWNASGATTVSNTTAIPSNLRILSSYSGNNGVTFSNGTNAYLVIYAPNTGVSISGTAPLFGTVAGKTVTISNSGMIHYDTRLKSIWPDIWSLIP